MELGPHWHLVATATTEHKEGTNLGLFFATRE